MESCYNILLNFITESTISGKSLHRLINVTDTFMNYLIIDLNKNNTVQILPNTESIYLKIGGRVFEINRTNSLDNELENK